MDVVFDGHLGCFFWCLEQGADVYVEAEVCKCGGDDFGPAVVAVLAELGDQYAGAAAFGLGKGVC